MQGCITSADADLGLLKGKKIADHRLRQPGTRPRPEPAGESGCDVMVGLYKGSKSWAKAEALALKVMTVAEAAREADVIMILVPDRDTKASTSRRSQPA